MMAAHATCTMNGSPSATWPTASTTAADAGAADTICAATLAAAALSATYAFKRDVALSSVSRAHRARHGASHAPFPSIPNLGATAIEAPRLASRRRAVPYPPPRRVPPPPAPDARAPDAARRRIQRARVSSTHRSRVVVLVALARVPPSTPRPARADRDPIEGSRRAFIAPPIASVPRPPSRAPASARSKSSPSRARASSPPSTSRAPPRVRARAAPRSRRRVAVARVVLVAVAPFVPSRRASRSARPRTERCVGSSSRARSRRAR